MTFKLTRSQSVDSALLRPAIVNQRLSELATKLKSVHTAPDIKPPATKNKVPDFDLLQFKDQYRKSVAVNLMSELSNDFKVAYEKGDRTQRQNLENVAIAIYLAKVSFASTGREDSRFEHLVADWLGAIRKGNKNPDCNFTSEQNFSVNRKNHEREAYQKSVNELGLFLKDAFKKPEDLANVIMDDVKHRCAKVYEHFGVDISDEPKYLQQAAFNAEKNMIGAFGHDKSSKKDGLSFLEGVTLYTNSKLNFPNYLRQMLSKQEKQPEGSPQTPAPAANIPASPGVNAPGIPAGKGFDAPPANIPAANTPAINLSNIGNPVINIDLGKQLEQLLEKAGTTNVYHIHNYHICDCQHASGHSALPHNVSTLVASARRESNDAERHHYVVTEEKVNEFAPSEIQYLEAGNSTENVSLNENDRETEALLRLRGGDEVDGAGDRESVLTTSREDVDASHRASLADVSQNDDAHHSNATRPAHDTGLATDHADSPDAAENTRTMMSEAASSEASTLYRSEITREIAAAPHSAAAPSVTSHVQTFERMFNSSASTPVRPESGTPAAAPYSIKPLPHIDTFIAKEERAGRAITLSQSGLLRPNIVDNDSVSITRRSGIFSQPAEVLESASEERVSAKQRQGLNLSPVEVSDNASPVASMTVRQRVRELEFNHSGSVNQQVRNTLTSRADSEANKAVDTSNPIQGDAANMLTAERADESVQTGTLAAASALFEQQQPEDARLSAPSKARPYSPYLDEKGNSRSRFVSTVDGLHPSRY